MWGVPVQVRTSGVGVVGCACEDWWCGVCR